MAALPSVGNAVQSSEMMRNSLGLNYKSAALNQLSYAGAATYETVFSEFIKSLSVTERSTRQFRPTRAPFAGSSNRKVEKDSDERRPRAGLLYGPESPPLH
jgi:hypothetical protein